MAPHPLQPHHPTTTVFIIHLVFNSLGYFLSLVSFFREKKNQRLGSEVDLLSKTLFKKQCQLHKMNVQLPS